MSRPSVSPKAPITPDMRDASHGCHERWWAIALTALALVALILLYLPFLRTYAVHGDDFALLLHSSRFFSPSPASWFLSGYKGYSITYPELSQGATNFVRPTINATVYLNSWLSPGPASVAMLVANYVGLAITTGLVYLIGRRIFRLPWAAAIIAGVLFFTSVAVDKTPEEAAYGGDMLATLFALTALLAIDRRLHGATTRWNLVAVVSFLTLSVFAKEAALTVPLVAFVFVIQSDEGLRGWRRLRSRAFWRSRETRAVTLVLAAPLLAYLVFRLRAGLGGNYALQDLPNRVDGVPTLILNPIRFLITSFMPVETDVARQIVTGGVGVTIQTVHALAAVVLNLFLWGLIALLAWSHRQIASRLLGFLLLGLLASGLPILLKADPRFMILGQALLLPLGIWSLYAASKTFGGRALLRGSIPVLMVAMVAVGPMYFFQQGIQRQHELVQTNRINVALESAIVDELRNPRVKRIYLIDAPPTLMPGMSALQFLAARAQRNDVRLRVINTLAGQSVPKAGPQVGVRFEQRGSMLVGTVHVDPSQTLFGYLTPRDARKLGQIGLISYGPIYDFGTTAWGQSFVEQQSFTFFIPQASRGDFAIVGLDPKDPRVHRLSLPSMTWVPVDGA